MLSENSLHQVETYKVGQKADYLTAGNMRQSDTPVKRNLAILLQKAQDALLPFVTSYHHILMIVTPDIEMHRTGKYRFVLNANVCLRFLVLVNGVYGLMLTLGHTDFKHILAVDLIYLTVESNRRPAVSRCGNLNHVYFLGRTYAGDLAVILNAHEQSPSLGV